jgi:hypothetical protein
VPPPHSLTYIHTHADIHTHTHSNAATRTHKTHIDLFGIACRCSWRHRCNCSHLLRLRTSRHFDMVHFHNGQYLKISFYTIIMECIRFKRIRSCTVRLFLPLRHYIQLRIKLDWLYYMYRIISSCVSSMAL